MTDPVVIALPAELAVTANREHHAAVGAGVTALGHAIAAGHALLLARMQIQHGGWERWLGESFDGTLQTARVYMRIARNAEAVLDSQVPSIAAADRLLTTALDTRVNPALREHAAALKVRGMRNTEIAAQLEISPATAQRWTNPQSAERQRKRVRLSSRAARRALKRADRDRAARKVGGPLSTGYSLVRRALDALEQAAGEKGAPARQIRSAMMSLYNAEDLVAAAIRTQLEERS